MPSPRRAQRWLRAPALHFLLIGALLYALDPAARIGWREEREPVVIAADRIEGALREIEDQTGRAATPGEVSFLIERLIDEELLLREARARGLDRGDRSIRFRLAANVRFLGVAEDDDPASLERVALELGLDRSDPVVRRILTEKMRLLAMAAPPEEAPSEAELRSFFERTAEKYRQPARVTLQHVFFAAGTRRGSLARDAAQALARLEADDAPPPMEAWRLGDPFAPGHRVHRASRRGLETRFGADFANAALAAEPGRWTGPVRSAYGLHLVRVEERRPSHLPAFESVRSTLNARLEAERGKARLQQALRQFRVRYDVRVEHPAWGAG